MKIIARLPDFRLRLVVHLTKFGVLRVLLTACLEGNGNHIVLSTMRTWLPVEERGTAQHKFTSVIAGTWIQQEMALRAAESLGMSSCSEYGPLVMLLVRRKVWLDLPLNDDLTADDVLGMLDLPAEASEQMLFGATIPELYPRQ